MGILSFFPPEAGRSELAVPEAKRGEEPGFRANLATGYPENDHLCWTRNSESIAVPRSDRIQTLATGRKTCQCHWLASDTWWGFG